MSSLRPSSGVKASPVVAVATAVACAGLAIPHHAVAQVTGGEEHCVVNVRTDDVLNVRRVPDNSDLIVNTHPHDEWGVIVTGECQGNWCPIEARHDAGWVHRHYISMVSPSLYCVTGVAPGDRLNVRAWPSSQSKVLTSLRRNQCDISFLPYATNGWRKIRVDGWQGWVNRRHLSGE